MVVENRFVDDTPGAGGVLGGASGSPATGPHGPERTYDEFYERYRRIWPGILRRMVDKADVDGVGQTASTWYNTSNVLFSIADTMTAGLLQLREHWTGEASAANERRMFALVARVQKLADEAAAMQTGLSMMSSSAGIAKDRAAGVPVTVPVNALSFGSLISSGVLDTQVGYQAGQTPEMARVVADVAVDYALIERKVWYGPLPERSPEPPPIAPDPAEPVEPDPVEPNSGTVPTTTLSAAGDSGGGTIGSTIGVHTLTPPAPVSSPLVGAVPGIITAERGRIAAPTGGSGGTGITGMGAGPGMMGMMGAPGASSDPARGSGKFWRDDEIAWSRDEHATWVDPDEQPPSTIGRAPA